jgi:hypothetical protein
MSLQAGSTELRKKGVYVFADESSQERPVTAAETHESKRWSQG